MTCTALCEGRATKEELVQPYGPRPGHCNEMKEPSTRATKPARPQQTLAVVGPEQVSGRPATKPARPGIRGKGCFPSVGVFFNRSPPYGRCPPVRKVKGHPNPVQQPYPTTWIDLASRA